MIAKYCVVSELKTEETPRTKKIEMHILLIALGVLAIDALTLYCVRSPTRQLARIDATDKLVDEYSKAYRDFYKAYYWKQSVAAETSAATAYEATQIPTAYAASYGADGPRFYTSTEDRVDGNEALAEYEKRFHKIMSGLIVDTYSYSYDLGDASEPYVTTLDYQVHMAELLSLQRPLHDREAAAFSGGVQHAFGRDVHALLEQLLSFRGCPFETLIPRSVALYESLDCVTVTVGGSTNCSDHVSLFDFSRSLGQGGQGGAELFAVLLYIDALSDHDMSISQAEWLEGIGRIISHSSQYAPVDQPSPAQPVCPTTISLLFAMQACMPIRGYDEFAWDSCKASLYKLLDCKVIDARDLRDLVDRNLQSLIEDTIEVDSSTLRVGSNYLESLLRNLATFHPSEDVEGFGG